MSKTDSEYRFSILASSSDATQISSLPIHLTSRKILVIDSILSGNRIAEKNFYRDILNPLFVLLDISSDYIETTSSTSVSDQAHSLQSGTAYLVIIISGDTSLNEFVNCVRKDSDVAFLTVAQGTGNAFANSIGLSTGLDTVKSLLLGTYHNFHLYRSQFDPPGSLIDEEDHTIRTVRSLLFFVVGSWCLHSTLVADSSSAEMRRKYGQLRFHKAAESILKQNPDFVGSIITHHKDRSFSVIESKTNLSYFIVTALPRFEPTFLISPNSLPQSHQLHLLYFPHTTPESTMEIMNQAYSNGSHISNPLVRYLAIDSGDFVTLQLDDSITSDSFSKICIDGNIILMNGKGRTVTFDCVESNLLYIR
ncbi:hypothetical protein FOA43_004500 [Brettanomyces nanus]|uniref:DAGKc domain-containing protein n=1 Tax=Eeniella nana TaxID=13502 RepID=A0A875RXY1_EENNA|nr:uncharacterized protein FOA43_004500 [Brettanomyces nanus]QPG77097.1 hypothetical protein FOA43_004500 [Brettanomyces nanus]